MNREVSAAMGNRIKLSRVHVEIYGSGCEAGYNPVLSLGGFNSIVFSFVGSLDVSHQNTGGRHLNTFTTVTAPGGSGRNGGCAGLGESLQAVRLRDCCQPGILTVMDFCPASIPVVDNSELSIVASQGNRQTA